jgi:hypothetical protein
MTNKEIIDVHSHYADFRKQLETKRNDTLEEVAQEFERMRIAFGDTAHSFAQYVREMKSEE